MSPEDAAADMVVAAYAAAASAFLAGLLAGLTLAIWWWG